MSDSIPVLCDRCGAAGLAGAADFSNLGDLLEFAPVPRQLKRRDGWTPVLQREFIARLAQSGSPQLAADAMGKCLHGIRKLRSGAGSDGFSAAWERAVALGEGVEARRRIAEQAGIQARDAHATGSSRSRGFEPVPDPEDDDMDNETKRAMVEQLALKFIRKVADEREARLEGKIVAADFYLRQVTSLEVAFDLITEDAGLSGWQVLQGLRRGGHGWLQIAETPLSRALDDMRRNYWSDHSAPERPEHPPKRYLADHGTHRTEPLEGLGGASPAPPGADPEAWSEMDMDEQRQVLEAQHAADAAEQVEWEASAHEAWEASEHGARAREAKKEKK